MNIVYNFGDDYAEVAGVSIVSLLENNRDCPGINLFVLDFGVSELNKERLIEIARKYGRDIQFIETSRVINLLPENVSVGHAAIASYGRLFLASLLPESVERAIYLDADTMVPRSLLPLWEEDLDGCVAGGAMDLQDVWLRKSLFLPPEAVYINAGVLLMDLKQLRRLGVEKKFIKFINTFNGYFPCSDQDVTNAVLCKAMKIINPKYNFLIPRRDYSYEDYIRMIRESRYISESEYNESKKNPVVVHFTGKGFSDASVIKAFPEIISEYMYYKSMTPWKDLPLKTAAATDGILKGSLKKMLYMLPDSLTVHCRNIFLADRFKMTYKRMNRAFKSSSIEIKDFRVFLEKEI